MSTFRNEHIEELLERFFEGQTSNAEEQRLYEFFAGDDVPEHLFHYKQVFSYFDNDIEEEINEVKADMFIILPSALRSMEEEFSEKEVPVRRIKKRTWIIWSGIAAAALLTLILLNPFEKPFDPYEGSYIIRNGVRITDPETIRPELEATVRQVQKQQEEADRIFNELMEDECDFFIGEESVQFDYSFILDGFDDENIRNEIKEILENN